MKTDNLRYINSEAAIPSPNMTNDEWQECFSLLRMTVIPSKHRKMYGGTVSFNINGLATSNDTYYGETLYSMRKRYINDVLGQMRKGLITKVTYKGTTPFISS